MATRLSVLPEDVARIVWRKVFDNVITEINKDVIKFYLKKREVINKQQAEVIKKADGLRKRYNKCKRKEQAINKMAKYANEYVDLRLKEYRVYMFFSCCWSHCDKTEKNIKIIQSYFDLDRQTQMWELLPRNGRFYLG